MERIAIDLAPGEQRVIPAFVQYLRDHGVTGIGGVGPVYAGPLTVVDPEGSAQGVFAGARTFTLSASGRFGVFYASAPVFKTTTDVWLYGLRQNTETRSNLAIVNIGEANGYAIDLYDGDTGGKVNTIENLSLAAGQWMQIGSILANFTSGVSNGYAHVRSSYPNKFISYAVINDGSSPGERTGDGAFIAGSP